MARLQTSAALSRLSVTADGRAFRMLLLAPEAPLIVVLMGVYWAMGDPPLVGVLLALLIVGFIARWLALEGARRSYTVAHYREASTLAQLALFLNPWSADALALRGSIALAQGQAARAEAALRRAARLIPDSAGIHTAFSGALLANGNPAEAAVAAHHALALAPNTPLALLYLAEAERALGVPALEVEDRLRAGLALEPAPEAEAALRCALAALLFAEEREAEAMLTLRGAEALLPRCRPASQLELRVRLGELMIAQGQLERAREQFRTVAALDPGGRYNGAAWRASHLL